MAKLETVNTDGAVIGKASFEQTTTGVLMCVVVGLPPGPRGIHLHATSSCSPDFEAAAGHIDPGQGEHGLRNPEGPDNGDPPHVLAAADGSAKAEFFSTASS